jgi:hypothetical protein
MSKATLLLLADMNNAAVLKNHASLYIGQHYDKVSATEDFAMLSREMLSEIESHRVNFERLQSDKLINELPESGK